MEKLWAYIAERYPWTIDVVIKLKTITLPGFDGIAVFDVYRFFIAEIKANSLGTRSKAIAFSFFLALFPALLFVVSLIPYIPYVNELDVNIMDFLRRVLPDKTIYDFVAGFLEPLLQDIANNKRGGLLTGSFIMVMFLTSNGVMTLLSSFDKSYEHYQKRNAFQSRITAFKITGLLVLLFIFSLGMVVVGQDLFSYIIESVGIENRFTHTLLDILRYVLVILMFFFGISMIYYYGPATKKKYKFMSTGATVATIMSLLVSFGFSYWVSNFNRLNVIFGSIGTIMLLMIWLNINAFILLIGYEINASIHYNTTLRTKELEVEEEAEAATKAVK